MISELPDDLLEEILCRTQAASLIQLQSTCKRWNRLVNNKRFTKQHLDKSAKQSLIVMLNRVGITSMSINRHGSTPIEVTGKIDLIHPHSSLGQHKITQCCQSDGLLLCVCVKDLFGLPEDASLVVWNPCTGQTKCIPPINPFTILYTYSLGSYKDKISNDISYKILSHKVFGKQEFVIYEVNSTSSRNLDVTLDCKLEIEYGTVSLKGKTYWFASDEKEKQLGVFLVSFDYTTERFGRLHLPYQYPRHHYTRYQTMSLSVVREEKLSVLLQRQISSKTEIWVSNKIGKTKVLFWIKVFALDMKPELGIRDGVSFLVDEEKKVLVCTQILEDNHKHMGYIIGEDNKVRDMTFGSEFNVPFIFNYVPSLIQVQQGGFGVKRNMNFFNTAVKRPRFEVAKSVENEPKASPVTDECCLIERTPILVQDNIWLKGDPGFPIQEQCFPKPSQHKTNQVLDKKFGLRYSTRKKKDSTRLSTCYGGGYSASKQFGEPSDAL